MQIKLFGQEVFVSTRCRNRGIIAYNIDFVKIGATLSQITPPRCNL